jgi:peptidoglycan/LPS O-acetylase OafA/YrhL
LNAYLLEHQWWYWGHVVNLLYARDGWVPALDYTHFWSLAVEEQFYLLWPVLVFLLDRRRLIQLCFACIAVAIGVRIWLAVAHYTAAAYVLMPARMDALAIGAVIALMFRDSAGRELLRRYARPVGLAAGGLLAAIALVQDGLGHEELLTQIGGYTLFAIGFGSLLIMAAEQQSPRLRRALEGRWLQFFGRYSYGLYIIHQPLILLLKERVSWVRHVPMVWGTQLPGQLLFMLLGIGVTTALALISWHCWESPFLRLKRFFPRRAVSRTLGHGDGGLRR